VYTLYRVVRIDTDLMSFSQQSVFAVSTLFCHAI